ncbi:MAG: hypothetical protein QXW60_06620 [Nitrososphaerota archaeon]
MVEEDVLENIVRRVYGRVSDVNYVKLKALVLRFLEYNPDADVEGIDWSAHYGDSLEFEELVEAFREAYPTYW